MELFYTISSFDRWQKFRDNFFASAQNKQSNRRLCRAPFWKEFRTTLSEPLKLTEGSMRFLYVSSKITCVNLYFAFKIRVRMCGCHGGNGVLPDALGD